jgi:hypothetical protein
MLGWETTGVIIDRARGTSGAASRKRQRLAPSEILKHQRRRHIRAISLSTVIGIVGAVGHAQTSRSTVHRTGTTPAIAIMTLTMTLANDSGTVVSLRSLPVPSLGLKGAVALLKTI